MLGKAIEACCQYYKDEQGAAAQDGERHFSFSFFEPTFYSFVSETTKQKLARLNREECEKGKFSQQG
jgi:hypothetical protein